MAATKIEWNRKPPPQRMWLYRVLLLVVPVGTWVLLSPGSWLTRFLTAGICLIVLLALIFLIGASEMACQEEEDAKKEREKS